MKISKYIKGQNKSWGDGYVHYLDYGDGFMWVYMYKNAYQILLF